MIRHESKILRSPSGYRIMVSDNGHTFAKTIIAFTDGEVHTTGAVRLNLIDKWNKVAMEDSIRRIAEAERGERELVAAVDLEPGWKKMEAAHDQAQQVSKIPSDCILTSIAPGGYIVYKDRNVVSFYSNGLRVSPTTRVLSGSSEEAVSCCHDLYPIQRCTDDRILHKDFRDAYNYRSVQ